MTNTKQEPPKENTTLMVVGIVGGIVVAILLMIYFWGVFNAPCETFRGYALKDVPARCLAPSTPSH